ADDRITFELMRRNDGAIRKLVGEPASMATAEELRDDLRVAIEHGVLPRFDVDYMAGAMYGVGFEIALRMVEREPVDVEGARRCATAPDVVAIVAAAAAEAPAGGQRSQEEPAQARSARP